jgi:hypothetical protein
MVKRITIKQMQPRGARRVARFALCAIAIATALVLSGNPAVNAATPDFEGTVVVRHSDDFASKRSHFSYLLDRPGRATLRLVGSTAKLTPGTDVAITGERSGDTVRVQSVETSTNGSPQLAPSGSPQKVAVILVNFADTPSEPWTPSEIQQTVFTGADSVNAYFQEESSGSVYLTGNNSPDGDVFGWYTIPNSTASCNFSAFASAAQAQAALAGDDLSGYDNFLYIWPDVAACNWSGLAYLPGSDAFINGAPTLRVISHELSHNFGVHHASTLRCTDSNGQRVFVASSCTASEYGDPFSVMGSSATNHSHALHKLQLGFLPFASLKTVAASGIYALSPSEQNLPGKTQLLRIPHGTTSTGQTDYYYLDYRQPFGSSFDNFALTDPAVNGVTVRIAPGTGSLVQSKLLDANPQTSSFGDAPIAVGESATDPATGVTISTVWADSDGATVNIVVSPPESAQPPTTPASDPETGPIPAAKAPKISFKARGGHVLRTRKLVISAGCEQGCALAANATVSLGKRRARLVPARAGAPPGTVIRLELGWPRSALALAKRAQRRHRAASIALKLTAQGSDGQTATTSQNLKVRP